MVPRNATEPEEWDRFADRSDDAWLWHRWHFCDAIATWPDVTDASFGLRSPDGELVGIFPLRRTEFTRARKLRFTRLDSLGGPAVDSGLGPRERKRALKRLTAQLEAIAGGSNDLGVDVALPPLAPRLRGERVPRTNPLIEYGFSNILGQTWIVDLRQGPEAIWSGLKKRARQQVRKAEKAGLQIRAATGDADLETYVRLHRKTYARTGVRAHPHAYFAELWRHFVDPGLARVFFAELDGEVIGAQNFGLYKGATIYWTGASDEQALENGANHLLQWRALEQMANDGIEWAEIGEAFPGTRSGKLQGLSFFKESFGGDLYPYYRGRLETPTRAYRAIEGLKLIRSAITR